MGDLRFLTTLSHITISAQPLVSVKPHPPSSSNPYSEHQFPVSLHALLAPVDAGYNRGGRVATCLIGTRKELIAKIERWIDHSKDRPICWLNGPAGSGKSAVAQTIAERCRDNRRLASSFFFFRGSGYRSKFERFIPTLAYQLSLSDPATESFIRRVLQSEPAIAHQSPIYQFQRLMIEPVQATRTPILSIFAKPMVIVIDALDECDDKELMAKFIEVITDACRRGHQFPFRVFFTSRVEDHLRKKLEANAAILPLALPDFDATDDIHDFFRSAFSTIHKENLVMRNIPSPWPSSSDLEALVKKASGSFIFASTLINLVNDGSDFPHRKLPIALTADAGLDPLYTQVLSAAPRSCHFEQVIGTIMVLESPLSVTSLGHLLRLEAADILQALLGVQSILMIPGDDNQHIQLFHTSLRDFLTKQSRSRDYFVDPPTHHLFIVMNCLELIGVPSNGVNFSGGAEGYVCAYWCHHLKQAVTEGRDSLFNALIGGSLVTCLTNLASQSFEFWFNTLLIGATLGSVLDALDLVLLGLKVRFKFCSFNILTVHQQFQNCPHELLQVLQDISEHAQVWTCMSLQNHTDYLLVLPWNISLYVFSLHCHKIIC